MKLSTLKLHNFRNFNNKELSFSETINIITGVNGSGKTSILEAIHLLATGRSFRTTNLAKLVNFTGDELAIYSEFKKNIDESNNIVTTIGYQRSKSIGKVLKLGDRSINSISEIANILPVCCLEGSFFRALSNEPQFRRQILDWGVFHVKHSFFSVWKKYKEVLQQRNKLLKTRVGLNTIDSWDHLFAEYAIKMRLLREEYLSILIKDFHEIIQTFTTLNQNISIKINHGVDSFDKESILAKLRDSLDTDIERGFTSFGPHRADLIFKCEKGVAKDILSRGQQKIVLIAFFLAQLRCLKHETDKDCVVLIDDLASELDNNVLQVLYRQLEKTGHQLVITAIDKKDFPGFIQTANCIDLV